MWWLLQLVARRESIELPHLPTGRELRGHAVAPGWIDHPVSEVRLDHAAESRRSGYGLSPSMSALVTTVRSLSPSPRSTASCHSSARQDSAWNRSSDAAARARRTSLSASESANWAEKSPCAIRCSLAACHGETSGPPLRAVTTVSVSSPN